MVYKTDGGLDILSPRIGSHLTVSSGRDTACFSLQQMVVR